MPTHKKSSFPLRISSVNVTKSGVFCGFGHTEEILNGKLIFLSSHEKVFFNLSNKEFANVCD